MIDIDPNKTQEYRELLKISREKIDGAGSQFADLGVQPENFLK